MYLTLKAIHIIFVVTWFSGLFYIVRLFVYLRETQDRAADEKAILQPQLKQMAQRLWYGITWPSAIGTVGLGISLLPYFWPPSFWLQAKLTLVALLIGYHLACHHYYLRLQASDPVGSGRFFRIWNEVATLFLVGIVFLVVLKDTLAMLWGLLGLVGLAVVLMFAITVYRRVRERSEGDGAVNVGVRE